MPRLEDPTLGFTEIEQLVDTGRSTEGLAAMAGLIGAAAFTHSAGYFVTFITGNSQRAILGNFRNERWLSIAGGLVSGSFVAGVVIASWTQPSTLSHRGGQQINSLSCQCYSFPSAAAP